MSSDPTTVWRPVQRISISIRICLRSSYSENFVNFGANPEVSVNAKESSTDPLLVNVDDLNNGPMYLDKHGHFPPAKETDSQSGSPSSVTFKERLRSLDAFRGLVIVLMILVDDAGHLFDGAIGHIEWNGLLLAGMEMFMSIPSHVSSDVREL